MLGHLVGMMTLQADPEERGRQFRTAAELAHRSGELRAAPYDPEVPGEGVWTVGYLFDVILTRDPWLHRVDLCRATGRDLLLTAEHDGRIVANVVADWAPRHGRPFILHLTGPAGGTFTAGTDGVHLQMDAVEFCRTLSGRETGTGLLATPVAFSSRPGPIC
jgi:hypothetical protein